MISGVGRTRFGELLETPELKGLSIRELTARAVKEALDDAGLTGRDVDAVFAGNAMVHSSQAPSPPPRPALRLIADAAIIPTRLPKRQQNSVFAAFFASIP